MEISALFEIKTFFYCLGRETFYQKLQWVAVELEVSSSRGHESIGRNT